MRLTAAVAVEDMPDKVWIFADNNMRPGTTRTLTWILAGSGLQAGWLIETLSIALAWRPSRRGQ